MNTTLRYWKEAATLILAAGSQHCSVLPKVTSQVNNGFDYEVLLLRRSQKSGFMPNAFVFPGGLVEPSDFSNEWLKVFERYIQKPNYGLGVVKQPAATRSPMFVTDRTRFGSLIPGEVAFRICAIRETFEESGVLLVVPDNHDIEGNLDCVEAYTQNGDTVAKWRVEVQKNPFQFIEMCKELRCVPNIWALHEWGNWLTPVFSKHPKGRRYDTAFFICCLQRKPIATDDQIEVTSVNWWTPQEAIAEHQSGRSWVPSPQFYDLSRLCNFTKIQDLASFSVRRSLEGCERWLPVLVRAEDGVVNTLPGDELYPDHPDVTGETSKTTSTDKTINDLIREGGRVHRLLHIDGVPIYFVNTQPKYQHVNPLTTRPLLEPKSNL